MISTTAMVSSNFGPGFSGSWICNQDSWYATTATTTTWNCFRFLPTASGSVAAADLRFATGTSTNVSTYLNVLGTAANANFKKYTVTQPTPVTKSAMSLLSSVAVAIGALAMLQ
jgi:hypothetical protein